MLRRLYNWVLSWADTPYACPLLFIIAFAESSFFPIPPDVLLIALCMGRPLKSFFYAGICTIASVLGGLFAYFIGFYFMEKLGQPIIAFYNAEAQIEKLGALYREYDALAIIIAGFSPLPYKIFTIAAGAFSLDLLVFTLASIFSRGARFFLIAFMIWKFGPKIKDFIDLYFNKLALLFVFLLILGIFCFKYVL